ncbi:MAG TPA: DUF3488 and transglutaminase-like domain-containing protein [Mycobacteriales bacterium]|nr:DUF3488 and transglutaminase-like domain-containing protein [Mycobacteriales bacterium]
MNTQLRLTAYAALATIATASSFLSVFKSTAWVVPVMGAIVLVAASCALIRSSPLPSALEPILSAIAILCWVTLLFARSKAHFGFIPGRLALRHLGHTARHGFTEVQKLPTPAPAHHGLVLLTVVGVAAVALVVDLMTVTLRRAALAGLPLLALFTVCAATGHHGVGLLPFVLASTGYLWLLFADNREKVARWGAAVGTGSRARPASAWSTDASSAPAPATLGRRVGAAAIGLGVVIPLFIPGLHTGIDKHGTGTGGSGSGGGSQVVLNPIVSVADDLTNHSNEPLISYRSSSNDPAYLRLTSLDLFNGVTFSARTLQASSRATVSENLPVAPPSGPIVSTQISISTSLEKLHWLPAPATTLGISVGNAWRYDPGSQTIFSATATGGGLRYTTRSVANDPTAAELASAPAASKAEDADLAVPAHLSPQVRSLTRRVTAHANNAYEAAVDIENFFTKGGRFTYSTNIPADNSPNALADFLLRTRTGFCQQFATGMAVMARLSGIPSRVAVGFTRGTQQRDGSWLVTTHDAHAWPELYFQGFGWLPFEPTPRGDGQAVTPSYARNAPTQPSTGGGGPSPTPSTGRGKVPSALSQYGHVGAGGAAAGNLGGGSNSTGSSSGGSIGGLVALIVVLVLVLLLVAPALARAVARRRRWRRLTDPRQAPEAAWAELRDTAIDLRLPWDDGLTPRQTAAALSTALARDERATAALRRVARCEEHARYAATPATGVEELRADVEIVRVASAAGKGTATRLMAMALPRSVLLEVRHALSRLGVILDVIDRAWAATARALHTSSWRRSDHSLASARS